MREFATTRLAGVETVHAMTVHKSQGSQAHAVSVVLPDEESRLLTRELFYTAVTRAQEQVRVVGTEAAIRAAVGREVQRASGCASGSAALAPSGDRLRVRSRAAVRCHTRELASRVTLSPRGRSDPTSWS